MPPLKTKQQLAKEQKASNARERQIAKQYLQSGPSILNLYNAFMHWYNSVPFLGGLSEDGNTYITGTSPAVGIKNLGNVIKVAKVARALDKVVSKGIKIKPAHGLRTVDKVDTSGKFILDFEYPGFTQVGHGVEANVLQDPHIRIKLGDRDFPTVTKFIKPGTQHVYKLKNEVPLSEPHYINNDYKWILEPDGAYRLYPTVILRKLQMLPASSANDLETFDSRYGPLIQKSLIKGGFKQSQEPNVWYNDKFGLLDLGPHNAGLTESGEFRFVDPGVVPLEHIINMFGL